MCGQLLLSHNKITDITCLVLILYREDILYVENFARAEMG